VRLTSVDLFGRSTARQPLENRNPSLDGPRAHAAEACSVVAAQCEQRRNFPLVSCGRWSPNLRRNSRCESLTPCVGREGGPPISEWSPTPYAKQLPSSLHSKATWGRGILGGRAGTRLSPESLYPPPARPHLPVAGYIVPSNPAICGRDGPALWARACVPLSSLRGSGLTPLRFGPA